MNPAPPPPPTCQNPSEDGNIVIQLNHKPNPDENPKQRTESRATANFRDFVMRMAAKGAARPLTAAQKSFIESHLTKFFPDSHTPDHPPYAAMINRAIVKLNEEGVSSEESISKFIRNEYADLPWAHTTFLKHHLRKLCESGEIVMTREKCFFLKQENQPKEGNMEMTDVEIQVAEVQNKVIEEQNQPKEERDEVFEELNQPSEKNDGVTVEQVKVEEEQNEAQKDRNQAKVQNQVVENGGSEERTRLQKQETGVREEQKQPEEDQNDATEGQNLSKEQQIEVIDEQNQLSGQEQDTKVAKKHSQLPGQQNRVIGGLSCSQIHEQQQQGEGEKPQQRPEKIWLRISNHQSATVTTTAAPFPPETLLHKGGTITVSPANRQGRNEQQQQQQQRVKKRRGRPPKLKPGAAGIGRPRLGRPPKLKPDAADKGRPRLGRPPKCKSTAGKNVENLQKQQQPKPRGRGRPRKVDSGVLHQGSGVAGASPTPPPPFSPK